MSTLAVIIIAKNEAEQINQAIESVSFANELIVIDSGSTDNTPDLARQMGAKVHFNPWPGYGPQKNFGASKASSKWLLFLDADEIVSPALAQQIQQTIIKHDYEIYWLRLITVFLGRPLNRLYGHNPRLIKKDAGSWNNAAVHEQIINRQGQIIKLGEKGSGLLTQPLLHHSHRTIAEYLQSMHRYTTLDARQMNITNKHRSGRPVKKTVFLPYYLYVRQLIKLLFYRRGILDSWQGIVWCFLSAYYEYEMAIKYLKLKNA